MATAGDLEIPAWPCKCDECGDEHDAQIDMRHLQEMILMGQRAALKILALKMCCGVEFPTNAAWLTAMEETDSAIRTLIIELRQARKKE